MASHVNVEYDLRLPSGGFVKLTVEADGHTSESDRAFILSVMGSVEKFAKLCQPEAPEVKHEVIGRLGSVSTRDAV